jgi:catechol 2,3-dioxygenase-like lactoylglutathione lyase family enzyme
VKIEHVALLVEKPLEVVHWYRKHLGMKVARAGGAPSFTHFLADSGGTVLLEVYRNDRLPVPDYRALDFLILHLAFTTDRVEEERSRLLAAGATAEGEAFAASNGDRVANLRDPWGLAIQLVQRGEPMLTP